MAVPRTRVKMRERAINVRQKLIIRETGDLGADEDDDQTDEQGLTNAADGVETGKGGKAQADKAAAVNKKSKSEEAKARKANEAGEQKALIPVPPIFVNEAYYRQPYVPWKAPYPYVKFFANCGSGVNNEFDFYDLRRDDVMWLRKYNETTRTKPLSEDYMELLIDLFEKESAVLTNYVDPSSKFPVAMAVALAREKLGIVGKSVEHIYEYWRARRKLVRKALMRKFQVPPEQCGAHVAFVPRTNGRRVSSRNPRKNDANSYRKMKHLRSDFERVVEMLKLMKKRELIKRHLLQCQVQEFDEKMAGSEMAKKVVQQTAAIVAHRNSEFKQMELAKRERDAQRLATPKREWPSAGPKAEGAPKDTQPLFREETPDFPGHWLGPLNMMGDAWAVHPQTIDSKASEEMRLASLVMSTIPRSDYVGFADSDDDGELGATGGKPKRGGPKKGKGKGKLKRNDKAPVSGFGRTSARTAARRAAKERGEGDDYDADGMMEDDMSDEDGGYLSDDSSDDEYFREVEDYLVKAGCVPNALQELPSLSFPMSALGPQFTDHLIPPKSGGGHHESASPPHRREHHEHQSEAKGFMRGRIGRGRRLLLDVQWNGRAEGRPMDTESSDSEDSDIGLIDSQFLARPPVASHTFTTVASPATPTIFV